MKKTSILVLSLFMLLCALSTTATFATDGEGSSAYATPVINSYFQLTPPTVDGNLSDSVLLLNAPILGTNAVAGSVWTYDGIVVGVNLGDSAASAVSAVINGKEFVYSIADSAFSGNPDGVSAKVEGSTVELGFSYAALGLEFSDSERSIPFALSLTNASGSYSAAEKSLAMLCSAIVTYDNCDDFANSGYFGLTWAASAAQIQMVQNTSSYTFKHTTKNQAIRGYGRESGGISEAPLEIEMGLRVNDLPVISSANDAGWRGFVFEMVLGGIRFRNSLTASTDGTVNLNVLYNDATSTNGITNTIPTGKKLGDTFDLRVSIDDKMRPTVYVDGAIIATLSAVDYAPNTAARHYYEIQGNYYNAVSGGFNVEIFDIALAKEANIDILENLTFDDIKGKNSSADSVSFNLELPDTFEYGENGESVPLVWSSSNPDFISDRGVIAYADDSIGSTVTMTASATVGGTTLTKSFNVTFDFTKGDKDMFFLFEDSNPYTGALSRTKINFDFVLDASSNSVGVDLGEVTEINTVSLVDSDDRIKMHRNDLSLYLSDDNVTYRRIKDFDLFRVGNKLVLANFSESARFVKVHCHITANEYISFENKLADIILVGNEDGPVAGGEGEFEKLGRIALTASKEVSDGIAYVDLAEAGISTEALCEDMRDLRFMLGTRTLRHYVEGNGAYVRIPEAKDGEIVKLDVYGGNSDAEGISDPDLVFEVIYGNRTIQNLTYPDPEVGFNHVISTARCPNGDIIAVGSLLPTSTTLTIRRSTDGGRTWDEPKLFYKDPQLADGCGFLVDSNRIFCFFQVRSKHQYWSATNAILVSDDNGYTWKNPNDGSATPYFPTPDKFHSLTYADGIKLSTFDGEGEGIDYLYPYAHASDNTYSDFRTTVIYTRDAGKTWQTNESNIGFTPATGNVTGHETGVSESSVVELPDGTLKLYARTQYTGNIFLGESTSYDGGLTWEENCTLTEVYSSNTFPVLKRFGDDVLLLWGGNNMQGPQSYFRAPISLAYSKDGTETWNAKHDILSGTGEGDLSQGQYMCVQPKLVRDDYMGADNMYIAWWKWRTNSNYGMLIEDASDYIYKTKGASDSFESTSLLYEGWSIIGGNAEITDAKASVGNHSMVIRDADNTVTRLSRSIPELYKGEISFDVNLENIDTSFIVEFKSALALSHYTGDRFAFLVDAGGNLKGLNPSSCTWGDSLAVLEKNKWYNLAVKFDIEGGSAGLFLDGEKVGDLSISDGVYGGICTIQLCDNSSVFPAGLTAYVDNFRAYEGTSLELCEEIPEYSLSARLILERGNEAICAEPARMNIYTDSDKETLVKSVMLESVGDEGTEIEASLLLESGSYYAEIIKNGYLTYQKAFTVDRDTVSLGDIRLIPGDIKGSFDNICGDGSVDVDDFIRVLRGFIHDSSEELRHAVDINEDGAVSVTDLALVKANFGKTTSDYGNNSENR